MRSILRESPFPAIRDNKLWEIRDLYVLPCWDFQEQTTLIFSNIALQMHTDILLLLLNFLLDVHFKSGSSKADLGNSLRRKWKGSNQARQWKTKANWEANFSCPIMESVLLKELLLRICPDSGKVAGFSHFQISID